MFLVVAFRTGLRLGEMRELRWKDIHLGERPRIRVRRQRQRNRATGQQETMALKGKKPRTIPLLGDVADALEAVRGRPEDLVFADRDGGHLDESRTYRELQKVGKKAGLPMGLNPHLARHSFGTDAASRGVPLHILQRWMGHSDVRTTMRYLHADPNHGAEFIDRLQMEPQLRVLEGGASRGADQLGGTTGGTNEGTPAGSRS